VVGAPAFTAVEIASEAFLLGARLCTGRRAILVFFAGSQRLESGFFVDFLEPAVLPFFIKV
jgi:hypothetical protein